MQVCFWEDNYAELVKKLLNSDDSLRQNTRNGITQSIFGYSISVDVDRSFPVLQGRKINYKSVLGELAAFLKGPKHIDDFKTEGCNYWDAFANPDGTIDLDYGNTWINFNGVDQLQSIIDRLKLKYKYLDRSSNMSSRRLILTSWRPDTARKVRLPCCHVASQFSVNLDTNKLSMVWFQRSADVMIGLPSDFVLASALLCVVCKLTGTTPDKIIFMLGDVHLYDAHEQEAKDYLEYYEYKRHHARKGVVNINHRMHSLNKYTEFNSSKLKLLNYTTSHVIKIPLIV